MKRSKEKEKLKYFFQPQKQNLSMYKHYRVTRTNDLNQAHQKWNKLESGISDYQRMGQSPYREQYT